MEQHCLSHSHLKLLSQNEIKNFLKNLKSGWEFLETQKIVKEFIFNDFSQAMKFVNQVAELAEKENHHPDIAIHYSKVEIVLWTHFVKGLSINDFILAVKIDNLSR